MNNKFTFANLTFLVVLLCGFGFSLSAQTTVFSDNFTTSAGTTYSTTPGAIGTSTTWNFSRSGVDMGAGINTGLLILSNDATTGGNNNGWVLASTSSAAFVTPYTTILNANPGLVTWTFNMKQQQANPSGLTLGNYGTAFILAGSAGSTNSTGAGYAVTLGETGKVDPLRLVSYTGGISNTTNIVASNTAGLNDFGNTYLSVKVTYAPSTNTWQLFVRNDGAAFLDPTAGTLTLQGTAVNSANTATSLPIMGAFWNAGTRATQLSLYDNVKVTVIVPITTSIAPPSKIAGTGAFTLTVNGSGFVSGTSVVRWNGGSRATTFVSATQLTAAVLAGDIASAGTASVTVANGTAVSNAQIFTIDPAGVPSISLSTSALNPMTTVTGTASSSQLYTVSGSNLTADVIVTAPANFEVSLNNTTFSNTITLLKTGSSLTGQPVNVYARVNASAPAGLYTATIDHSTTGGAAKSVTVTATVIAAKPTIQATAVTFTTVTSTTFNVNWTNGNGASHLVLIKTGSAVNSSPTDGTTYTAINSLGAGSEIGTGNFVIYSGSANTVNVTGLQPNTAYHIAVYDYNGTAGTEGYLTTTPATGNRTTLNAPVGWQIYNANTTNLITFDSTVDGVNEGIYQATGMSNTLVPGDLNSNAWAIAGFSDGAVAFGGNSVDATDFDRGIATAGVTVGGVYAFETATNNLSLGIKPATGDFVPGTVTLRFQNQTGAPVTSLSIGYKVYVYNDQAASNSFNFSHSADNTTYTAVAGLNVISAAAADAVPSWKSYYRVVTLTGLNIANNNYYHFRWTGATVSGTTNFDEFALDDIVMVANPTTNFASFNGTAENFIVLGNTLLSGATTVTSDLTLNGGKVDINGATLTLNGTVTNTTLQGLKGSATSNLIVGGAVNSLLSFDQTTLGTSNLLNNLTVATTNSNTVSLGNALVVDGTLATNFGQTLNLATNTLTGILATVANNGTITTQNTTATPVASGKTWNGTGIFNYNATSASQTVVGGTYQNLTISTSGGGVAATSFNVNGALYLPLANPSATSGSLSTGNFVLTMGGSATNTGIGDVTGIVTRNSIVPNITYTFGNPFTSILFPNVGTLPSTISLKTAIGTAPAWRTGAINRTFDFIQTGASGTKAILKAHYLDAELNGNIETKLVDWAYIVSSSTSLEQGRSNYNTTDNWVELTNANIGLYFTGTFGQVLVTLDESAATSLTWNGSVSTSWTTATNWTPNATPSDATIVYIPDAATTLYDPILNPSVLLGSLDIEAGGILNAPDNEQFTINNGAGAWINYGTYNAGAGTSTVIFTNADATMSGSTNFNNVTVNSGSLLRPLTNNIMQIAGQLTLNGPLLSGVMVNTVIFSGTGQTIPNPNGPVLNAYHNLIINGSGAVFPASLNIMGALTLNQAVDFSGKSLFMTGMQPQTIAGTVAPTFNNLTVNNTGGGVSLATNAAVNGALTLTSGILNVANSNLTLGAAAVSGSFSAANMIACSGSGEVRRNFTTTGTYTFPIGDLTDAVEYSPITVNVTAGSFTSAYVGVSIVDAIHPNNASALNNLSRYWKVNQSGITGALATITATYLPVDLTGAEATISAGQLNGTFNQASNGWIKYSALAGNSLTATGAIINAGQTAAFTGIKGGTYSAAISGYGTFCVNDAVTLTATPAGGDAPYTYAWSAGLGNQATATAPSSAVGTTNYSVTVTDSNGLTASDNETVIISAPAVAGTVFSAGTWCYNKRPDNITVSGFTGTVQKWQYASDAAFTSPTDIASTATVLEQVNAQLANTTIYYRAFIGSANTCPAVATAGFAVTGATLATYSGAAWVPAAPNTIHTSIIFDDNYAPTGAVTLIGCDCTVNGGKVVVIPSASLLDLQNEITVSNGVGTKMTFENNSVLLQAYSTYANSGNVEVKRNSSSLMRLDYTAWSSPVIGTQTLKNFSPSTVDARFYVYNTATNFYNATNPLTTTFGMSNVGKGFLIRMPNDHPATATVWTGGKFIGTPSNGTIPVAISTAGTGFNLIGNPYLSQINITQFLADNSSNIESTLYFWRKTNEAVPTNPAQSGYCTYTGGNLTQGSSFTNGTNPLGKIQVGQGFMVKAKAGATNVTFNNGMRLRDTANHFFKAATNSEVKNTFWLNLGTSSGGFAQMASCYRENASMGVDDNDGLNIGDGQITVGSFLDNKNYVIQSRTLPFDTGDVMPLTFTVNIDGNYTFAIDHVDGLFSNGAQTIYVRDNVLNTVTNLTAGNYTFATAAGTFNNRFDIVYQPLLSTTPNVFNENSVVVYKNNGDIIVNTGTALMKSVQIYDMRGSLLLDKTNVNAAEIRLNIGATSQVVLVKTTLEEGPVVTKKVIN